MSLLFDFYLVRKANYDIFVREGRTADAEAALPELEKLHNEMHWACQAYETYFRPIPVSERLPELWQLCLMYFDDPEIAPYARWKIWQFDGQMPDKATHWLPMPQKP